MSEFGTELEGRFDGWGSGELPVLGMRIKAKDLRRGAVYRGFEAGLPFPSFQFLSTFISN